MNKFLEDVLSGLQSQPKQLQSKYFYDETGDILFQKIMQCEEYYLTNCEMEIFKEQTTELAETLQNGFTTFDLIELGAGDATKSSYLIRQLIQNKASFTYYPIDISSHVIEDLEQHLPQKIEGLNVVGLNGEYFEMLTKAYEVSANRKVVLFMGANIGNMAPGEALEFCKALRAHLAPDDLLLMGFDLKKHPHTIRAAYNDKAGFTRAFNLNLLKRINRELSADFVPENFEHYPSYDPSTGACKSYLVSLADQEVQIGNEKLRFEKDEFIAMEISQKYTVQEVESMALSSGFEIERNFFDQKRWFMDSVWKCV